MSDFTKQHYVPRFYLKHFCIPQRNQVYVYDKQKRQKRIGRINDIAEQRNFYDLDLREMGLEEDDVKAIVSDPHMVEKFFSANIEPCFSQLIKSIISRYTLYADTIYQKQGFFDYQEKEIFSYCLAYQYYRIAKIRNLIQKISEKTKNFADKLYPDIDLQLKLTQV